MAMTETEIARLLTAQEQGPKSHLSLNHEVTNCENSDVERMARYEALLGTDALRAVATDNWNTDVSSAKVMLKSIHDLQQDWGTLLYEEVAKDAEMGDYSRVEQIWGTTEGLTQLWLRAYHCSLVVSRFSSEAAWRTITRVRERLPVPTPIDDTRKMVAIGFWMMSPQGPTVTNRVVEVHDFQEVRENYSTEIRGELETLMSGFHPSDGGRLVLWHGVPGTGKTHAIRALSWEWRKWASFNYIVDPEVFFGTPLYMMGMLLKAGVKPSPRLRLNPESEDPSDEELGHGGKWTVLILEDCGELITEDAKSQTGQGLSRLLNLVDGLLGQGLKVLLLITTNEPLAKLHDAVQRPGRAIQTLEFDPLSEEEAQGWLNARGSTLQVTGTQTIAQLYAKLAGRAAPAPGVQARPAGFGAHIERRKK
jgi:hypothetical protein